MKLNFAFTYAIVLAFGALLASMPAAHATTLCTTTVTGPTLIKGAVTVPSGNSCTLGAGVTVAGGVTVMANASLSVTGKATSHTTIFGNVTVATGSVFTSSGGTITGNVTGTQCEYIALGAINDAIIIGGNLSIQGCSVAGAGEGYSGYPNGGDAYSVTVRGNVLCENNASSCYLVGGTVGGYATVTGNGPNPSVVGGNAIRLTLQCQSNTGGASPVGNGGFPNTVAGGEQGQCTGL